MISKSRKQTEKIIKKYVTIGMVCFDIGSGAGTCTIQMAKKAGKGVKIYTFEDGCFEALTKKVQANYPKIIDHNVIREKMILSDEDRWEGKTNFMTLDKYIVVGGINKVDFIRFGYKNRESRLKAIAGAKKTLKKFNPFVLIEEI